MDDFDLQIHGLAEMEKNLVALGAELGAKALRGALRDAGAPIEDYMKANAPESEYERVVKTKSGGKVTIRPGFLKSRIKRKSSLNKRGRINKKFKNENDIAVVQVGVFKIPYVKYVEYGTKYVPARSFIRSAKAASPAAIAIFRSRLIRRIGLAERRLQKSKGKSK